jgi:hypothetical protein
MFELMATADGSTALTIVNEQGQVRVVSKDWEKYLGNYLRRINAKIEDIDYGGVTAKWQKEEFERFQEYCKITENLQGDLDYFDEELEKTVTFSGEYADLKLRAYLHWTHVDGMPDAYKDPAESAKDNHSLANILVGALAVMAMLWSGRLVKEKAQQVLTKVSFNNCLDGLALATAGGSLTHDLNPVVLGLSMMMYASRVNADSLFPAVLELSSLDGVTGFKLDGEAANNWSSYSVSSAGDVNGDNITDLIVGAYYASPSSRNRLAEVMWYLAILEVGPAPLNYQV